MPPAAPATSTTRPRPSSNSGRADEGDEGDEGDEVAEVAEVAKLRRQPHAGRSRHRSDGLTLQGRGDGIARGDLQAVALMRRVVFDVHGEELQVVLAHAQLLAGLDVFREQRRGLPLQRHHDAGRSFGEIAKGDQLIDPGTHGAGGRQDL